MMPVLLFCLFASAFAAEIPKKVQVDVYYETLCPDSVKAMIGQVMPVYNMSSFMNLLSVNLVPFGKAKVEMIDGKTNISCHHGEAECFGNKIQGCAIKKAPTQAMAFINCLMKGYKETPYPVQMCGTQSGIQAETLALIESCGNSTEGMEILIENGNKTAAYQNPLKSVPSIVVHGAKTNINAVTDFQAAVCDAIPANKPAECTKKNGAEMNAALSFVPLVFALIVSRL